MAARCSGWSATTACPRCVALPDRRSDPGVPGSFEDHLRRIRTTLGRAIVGGDLDEVVGSYLALAEALAAHHCVAEAIAELEDGIGYLTRGAAKPSRAPHALWQMMATLVHRLDGESSGARRLAALRGDHTTDRRR